MMRSLGYGALQSQRHKADCCPSCLPLPVIVTHLPTLLLWALLRWGGGDCLQTDNCTTHLAAVNAPGSGHFQIQEAHSW